MTADMHVIEQLRDQIMQMWEDKSYQRGGNEPYKMASRMALLSFLLDGGTLFNCKSGKDRTAQLDIETKFLAFQIKTNNATVPIPDHERTVLEKIQMAIFTFEDESRRTMQEYNTGHGGSKLRGAWALYDAFTVAFSDSALAIKEYLGGSGNAGS
jgi:phosphatidylinositol-4,5-bisphosphate 4-phosphatase